MLHWLTSRIPLISILALLVVIPAFAPRAARSAAPDAHPVIVVFRSDANLSGNRGFYHADDRAQRHPDMWNDVDQAVGGTVQSLEVTHGFRARHVYSHAVRGFAATLDSPQIDALRHDPRVASIEPDGVVTVSTQTIPWGIHRIDADGSSTLAGNGSGWVTKVHAYIIDTGIYKHPDLYVTRLVTVDPSWTVTDCHGHGTHVSGTVAAKDNTSYVVGVTPGAPLVGVKVLDCTGTGTVSGVIKGVDWVTANAIKPAVANMSLGGPASDALDTAVRNSAASGIFYAIAAGNSATDACSSSPARVGGGTAGVMTVAATDGQDVEASWSNYGACVDVWAPGVNILSTRIGGGTTTMSGTSMATPHVTGTAALYLSRHTTATPSSVETAIRAYAKTTGTVSKDGAAIHLDFAGSF